MKYLIVILLSVIHTSLIAQHSISATFGASNNYRTVLIEDEELSLSTVFRSKFENNSTRMHIRYGIDYTHALDKKLEIITGLRYAATGYNTGNEDAFVWASDHDGNGGVITDPRGSVVKMNVKHTYVEIPLLIRYIFTIGKLKPFIQAGINPHILLSSIDYTHYQNGDSSDSNVEFFKKPTFEFVPVVGIGFKYEINELVFTNLTFAGRYHLEHLSNKNAVENLYSYGAEIGFGIKLLGNFQKS